MGDEADADWQDGLVEWGREDTMKALGRCPTCGRSDAEYSRKSRPWRCNDPWHGDDHLRKPHS